LRRGRISRAPEFHARLPQAEMRSIGQLADI
jgi:hypothetical protein